MKPIHPKASSKQLWTLLNAFRRGERLTTMKALFTYNVMALSQRCTDLRKLGWPIKSKLVRTARDKHVAEYWMAK